MHEKKACGLAWWTVMLILGGLRQESVVFKDSLSHTEGLVSQLKQAVYK